MAEIIKCPKCDGCGHIWEGGGGDSTVADHQTVCPSCGGKGYVTSGEGQGQAITIKTSFQVHPILMFVCPHCGRLIELEVRSGEK